MIGKSITGNSFNACINYCLDPKKHPEILDQNEVYGKDKNQLARQFNMIAKLKQNLSKPVWHATISFAHDDKISNALMLNIAKEYLDEIGLSVKQFLIVKHNDTNHKHCHLVINKVGMDGIIANDWKSGYRTKVIMQKLERKYGLVIAKEQKNKRHERIALTIESGLNDKLSINEILQRVQNIGYQIIHNKTKQGVIRGISFKDPEKGIVFKSSQINRKYSYANLLKASMSQQIKSKSKQLSR